jgi:hypothetical protein
MMSADRLRGVGLAMVGMALLALAAPAAARADAVIDWNQHAIDALARRHRARPKCRRCRRCTWPWFTALSMTL